MNNSFIQELYLLEEISVDETLLNDNEYIEIANETKLLKELFHEINDLTNQSNIPLITTEKQIINTVQNVEDGVNIITKMTKNRVITYILLSSVTGLVIGGPLGLVGSTLLCSSTGAMITLNTILLGGALGSVSTGGIFGSITGLTHYVKNKLFTPLKL